MPLLRLLLAGVGQRRFAGVFCGTKASRGAGFGAEQLPPEAGELEIEDGDLLGTGDDAGARGVIDVVVAEDIDRGQGVDERQDLTGADRQPGVAQPAAKRQQVGLDSLAEIGGSSGRTPSIAVVGHRDVTGTVRPAAGRGRRGSPPRRRARCRRPPGI